MKIISSWTGPLVVLLGDNHFKRIYTELIYQSANHLDICNSGDQFGVGGGDKWSWMDVWTAWKDLISHGSIVISKE